MAIHLLPATRRVLLLTTSLVSLGNAIAAAALLGYQLNFTAVSTDSSCLSSSHVSHMRLMRSLAAPAGLQQARARAPRRLVCVDARSALFPVPAAKLAQGPPASPRQECFGRVGLPWWSCCVHDRVRGGPACRVSCTARLIVDIPKPLRSPRPAAAHAPQLARARAGAFLRKARTLVQLEG